MERKKRNRIRTKKKTEGYLTVTLTMLFAVSLGLALTLLYGARRNGMRLQTLVSFDNAMNATLAEYHRELLSQYDLFFIDMSYGGAQGSPAMTEGRIRRYLDGNFTGRTEDKTLLSALTLSREFDSLRTEAVTIDSVSVATDDEGLVFRRQAEAYAKHHDGVALLEDIGERAGLFQNSGCFSSGVDTIRNENQARIDAIPRPKKQNKDGSWETVELENPADSVTEIRNRGAGTGLLQFVVEDTEALSYAAIQPDTLTGTVGKRELFAGDGVNPMLGWNEGLTDRAFFYRYLSLKAADYTRHEEKNALKYQLEYLLCGKSGDVENLKVTVNRLTLLREAINVAYIFTDSAKKAEARTYAAAISAILLEPEFIEPVTISLLLAWAYMESLQDVKILLEGGRVPLQKTAANWKTDLLSVLLCGGLRSYDTSGGEGFTYREYLLAMLFPEQLSVVTCRMLDMIERDIRKTAGNERFRMDLCIDAVNASASVRSKRGESFVIERQYGYD